MFRYSCTDSFRLACTATSQTRRNDLSLDGYGSSPLLISDPEVQSQIRAELQDTFEARTVERIAALCQAERGLDPDEAKRRAEASVEQEMHPALEAALAQRNKDILESHRKEFPYSEFTFALITLVLRTCQWKRWKSSLCTSRTRA